MSPKWIFSFCALFGSAALANDSFRWLEEGASSKTQEWISRQNKETRGVLDPMAIRPQLDARMKAMASAAPVMPALINGKYFAIRGGALTMSSAWDAKGAVIVDPKAYAPSGFAAIADYRISPDGTKVAYGISFYGSDLQDWYVRNLADGSDVPGFPLKNIRIRGTSWSANSDGLYYTRWPDEAQSAKGVRYNKVFFHPLSKVVGFGSLLTNAAGSRSDSVTVSAGEDQLIFESSPRLKKGLVGIEVNQGSHLLVSTYDGFDERSRIWIRAKNSAKWTTLLAEKHVTTYVGSEGTKLFYRTNSCGNRFCLAVMDIQRPGLLEPLVSETQDVLMSAQWIGGHFILTYSTAQLETKIRIHDLHGQLKNELRFPEPGLTSAWTGNQDSAESYFSFSGYRSPPTVFRYTFADHARAALNTPTVPVALANVETRLVHFKSADGERVPLQLIYRRGINPKDITFTYLSVYGFGGADGGGNVLASYSAKYLTVLEMGGVVAVANIRGGGEKGESWHGAGKRFRKWNSFHDTIGAAQWLIANGWARKGRISLYGRSGGGLVAAAALTIRPDLFGSVSPTVPITDLLRYHLISPSAYRWDEELGTADNLFDFLYLKSWSPYHNLQAAKKYPPVLIFASDRDDRAGMAHGLKLTAALQALGAPAHLYVTPNVGHFYRGETLDELSFIAKTYGIETLTPF